MDMQQLLYILFISAHGMKENHPGLSTGSSLSMSGCSRKFFVCVCVRSSERSLFCLFFFWNAPFSGFSLCSPSFVRSGISRLINSTFIFYVESFRDAEVEAGVECFQGWNINLDVMETSYSGTKIWL